MVSFNGVGMETVAPVEIINITAPAPKISTTSLNAPGKAGAAFVSRKSDPRVITITFDLKVINPVARHSYITALRNWAFRMAPAKLILPQEPSGYLMAVCTQMPDGTYRDWWEDLTIQFTAFEPCFTANAEKGITLPGTANVGGLLSPIAQIRANVTAAITAERYWSLNNRTIRLTNIPGTGSLVIDNDAKTITLAGVSILNRLTVSSLFWLWSTGGAANAITTNMTGSSLYWRERWL